MKKTLLICAAALLLSASVAQPQNIIATTATCTNATIDAGTAGCVIINVAGQGSLGFQITGTWTGTVTFSTSLGQNGADATFVTTLVTPVGSATQTSTATANGVWSLPVAGFNQFKIAITATGTGTAVVNRRTTSQARSGGGGGGGSGTPGGSDTQVQYNDGGAFGGDAGLTFNETSNALTMGSGIIGVTTIAAGSRGLNFTVPASGTITTHLFTSAVAADAVTLEVQNSDVTEFSAAQFAVSSSGDGLMDASAGFYIPGDNTDRSLIYANGPLAQVKIGTAGVLLNDDGDGALTILGNGNGSDEDLTFNFDDVANTVGVSSSTGVITIDFATALKSTMTFVDTNGIGGFFVSTTDDNGSGTTQNSGVQSFTSTAADAGNYVLLTGLNSDTEYYATGTLNVANGVNVYVYNDDGIITSMEGIRIEVDNQDTATNTYGVRILSVTGGTQTNLAWSFFSADDASRSRIPNLISAGTTPSVANVGANSCGTTAASVTGNSNSGRVTVGATSGTQCRVTTTITAPTGWQCSVSNTTTAALARCVGVDTTHFDLVGVFTAADVLSYVALPN